MTRGKWPWCVVAVLAVAGVFVVHMWSAGGRKPERGPVKPGGMVDTVEADGAKSFIALPPSLPHSKPAAALGAEMFREPRLARTTRRVCGACHLLNECGTDGQVRKGVLTRPAANAVFATCFLHDGSVTGLANVVRLMFESPDFSGCGSLERRTARLRSKDAKLAARFASVYADGLTSTNVVDAVVQFAHSRPMLTGGTAFDLFCGGRTNALNDVQLKGLEIFRDKCISCHDGATLGARGICNGLKVPALRGIPLRHVFFSDGSCTNLSEAVSHQPGIDLDEDARTALVELLRAL